MLSWPGVLVFALATWGILAKPSRLDSRRPVESRPTSAPASKSGEIPSRLWDSPFSSLPPVQEGNKDNNGSPSVSFSNQLDARLQQLNAKSYRRFTVATVCMPSPHSSEDLEQARRRRWAVVSALHASGAIPLHPDRIEMAEFTANARDESDRETSRKFTVPHEWFAVPGSASAADPAVCEQLIAVVWLDEAQLGDRPLDDLSLLLKAIEDETRNANVKQASPPTFSILGPLTSNMLASFAEHWNRATTTARKWPSRTLFINTDATSERARGAIDAAARALATKAPRAGRDESRSQSPLIVHTIGTDADLARRTVKELRLRRSSTKSASVALLAEWDTDYGRDVLPTFRQAFMDEDGADHDTSRLWEFTFPRGLDGTPVASANSKKGESGDSDLETASGAAQLDYLRRLVKRLKDRPVDEPPLRAIGILASDVYDKLLLLRALRDEFPNVVIFTTDLDQRLLHPAES
ncbi:MAG TPA: hypothetical protein PLV92_09280, partial [Pirellulaceae bacterium]|nr:hypothetical protein [Pirellulaceae bacterium]